MSLIIALCAFILIAALGLGAVTAARAEGEQAPVGTDALSYPAREAITRDLVRMVDHSPELKALLEQSIGQALRVNPDPATNPVRDLKSYFAFVDHCARAMPWDIWPRKSCDSLYWRIDQGMGCLYFAVNQPLEALRGRGYYHDSLLYHEPMRSWFVRFLSDSGRYLSTEASWNDQYLALARAHADFHLTDGTYESPENWRSFNDFFARRLSSPSVRPIAAPGDGLAVVSPADSVTQGVWPIGADGRVITGDDGAGVPVKTGTLTDVAALLGPSRYARSFAGGAMTHVLLDVYDYHRFHFPVSGTVREVSLIRQDDAPGGVITWDEAEGRYRARWVDVYGWQAIETRGVVVVEMDSGALCAIVPVGMCQVASVCFEDGVAPGARFEKGDPLGYFQFGGSDIVMLFDERAAFELTAPAGAPIRMGERYGQIGAGLADEGSRA